MKRQKLAPSAMMFYHPDGFVPAFSQATTFAGKGGHVGTMLDVVNACISTGAGSAPWENYATTMSAEYVGRTRGGNKVIVVAHGIGPMATRPGVLAAYSYDFKDKSRSRNGGRISQEEFWKLESGAYGEVQVVDLVAYLASHEYPFISSLRASEVVGINPVAALARARLGPQWGAYLAAHVKIAKAWGIEEGLADVRDPFVLTFNDASQLPYEHCEIEEGLAFAHLLSIGQLCNVSHSSGEGCLREQHRSLLREISGHGWYNGTRLIGVHGRELPTDIHPGVGDLDRLLWKNRERLMLPNPGGGNARGQFFRLMTVGKNAWFTMVPHKGHNLGSGEAEFKVTSIQSVGSPVQFRTKVQGYYGFFRYDMRDVRRLAPASANAFEWADEPAAEPGTSGEYHIAQVQFYRVEVDTSQRLMRSEQLQNDFELMMELLNA